MGGTGQHSSKSMNHGTPVAYVEAARYTMGGIDFDPCSNAYWNHHVVKAPVFYDGADYGNGLEQGWRGRGLINSPGDKKGTLPPQFWDRSVEFWWQGEICGIWIGFSLEQLPRLQRTSLVSSLFPEGPTKGGEAIHPLNENFLRCVPRERMEFLAPGETFNDPPTPQTQPGHGNYILFLPPRGFPELAMQMGARFIEAFSTFGAVF